MIHPGEITNVALRLRAELATSLCIVLGEAHPDDAACICAAFLDDMQSDGPRLTTFGDLRADAAFWADCAHPPELEEYFYAALKCLGRAALGIEARKRLFKALWHSFSDADRAAFLRRVNGGQA